MGNSGLDLLSQLVVIALIRIKRASMNGPPLVPLIDPHVGTHKRRTGTVTFFGEWPREPTRDSSLSFLNPLAMRAKAP